MREITPVGMTDECILWSGNRLRRAEAAYAFGGRDYRKMPGDSDTFFAEGRVQGDPVDLINII